LSKLVQKKPVVISSTFAPLEEKLLAWRDEMNAYLDEQIHLQWLASGKSVPKENLRMMLLNSCNDCLCRATGRAIAIRKRDDELEERARRLAL
jgi:hypothetical protein